MTTSVYPVDRSAWRTFVTWYTRVEDTFFLLAVPFILLGIWIFRRFLDNED